MIVEGAESVLSVHKLNHEVYLRKVRSAFCISFDIQTALVLLRKRTN